MAAANCALTNEYSGGAEQDERSGNVEDALKTSTKRLQKIISDEAIYKKFDDSFLAPLRRLLKKTKEKKDAVELLTEVLRKLKKDG